MSDKITKAEMREIIDKENGAGFSSNINLNGYVFTKNGSFIVFEFKSLEETHICHIKYIHFKNKKDLTTILVNCCNFWMGNKVQFIYFKEKQKKNSPIDMMRELNFRVEEVFDTKWKYAFECSCDKNKCNCKVYSICK